MRRPTASWDRLLRTAAARAHEIGLDDAGWRELLERVTGKASCHDITANELCQVLRAMGRVVQLADWRGVNSKPEGG